MSENGERACSNRGWLLLAGVGIAAGLCAWVCSNSRRASAAVGAHAWLVPKSETKQEAEWSRHASIHSSESKVQ